MILRRIAYLFPKGLLLAPIRVVNIGTPEKFPTVPGSTRNTNKTMHIYDDDEDDPHGAV